MSLDDVKSRILGRVPLVSLIGESVALTLRGDHHAGLCPFHDESGASFAVYHDHFYCYGCKVHGDAITYVRRENGFGFVEALRYLASKYSIEAPELDESAGRQGRAREEQSLYGMMAEAQLFFETNLHDGASAPAREALTYLESRGFSQDNIKSSGFGLTPDTGGGLVRHLSGKGHKEDDMVACSLASRSTKDNRVFDFYRNRVTLPIRDPMSRVIGFGGRTMDGNPAKYINSRDTKLFDKSNTLFGFDRARKKMREQGRAIVVEGYMDALMLWQAGLEETVACLGTAFTDQHLKLLHHATSNVVLLFDGDPAGQKATLASVNVALTLPEMQVRAVQLPDEDDPDDFVRKHGVDALRELITKSEGLLDFAIGERLRATHALGVPGLVMKELLPWLSRIPDRIQRAFLTAKIAQLTGIPKAQLEAQLPGGAGSIGTNTAPAAAARQARARAAGVAGRGDDDAARAARAEKALDTLGFDFFGMIFHAQPGEIGPSAIRDCASGELELDDDHAQLAEDIAATLAAGTAPATADSSLWMSMLAPRIVAVVDRLAAAERAFACPSAADRTQRFAKLLSAVRVRRVRATIATLKSQMARLSAIPGNDNEVRQILSTISELTKQVGP